MIIFDWTSLVYLVVLLLVLGGFLLVEFRGRMGSGLRMFAAWVLIFIGAIAVAGLWPLIQQTVAPQAVQTGDGEMMIPIRRDGHAYLTAKVNGVDVRFVVDTGASLVALSRDDAERVGLNPDDLAYYGLAQTANGRVRTAPVMLKSISIGDFVGHDVSGAVIDGDVGMSLLGMAFLSRFARVSFEGDRLMLEW